MRIRMVLSLAVLLLASTLAFAGGATITIVNGNAAGVGFNDATPAAPVGGNSGATVGEQRLIAFRHAANIWGSTLDSNVEIRILATFEPLSCTATSAVLGSAGALVIVRDFPGAEYSGTFYHVALGNKQAGFDLVPPPPPAGLSSDDLRARFNSNLGNPTCLAGSGWYYGLDANEGSKIDLVAVLLHEFGHGLGFQQFASVTSGAMPAGLPDVYNRNLFDLTQNKSWPEMTNAQRAASTVNSRRVVWTGAHVSDAVPGVLAFGVPLLRVHTPASIAGIYAVGAASFGPALASPGVSGNVVQALDAADAAGPSTTDGCSAIANAGAVAGNIAIVDRGTCGFVVKVKNAQNAGAVAVIVADNAVGSPPAGLGGADATIVIPSARVTLGDGGAIKARLAASETVSVTLGVDLSVRAGADVAGRALMNAPNPVQPGSSISHWDPIASPNQLMEPAINSNLTHSITPPQDLTLPEMRDVGWWPDGDLDQVRDDTADQCLGSDLGGVVTIGGINTGVANTFFTNGCSIADLVNQCSVGAVNHGDYAACAAHVTDGLRDAGWITGAQKGAIQSAAARNK